MEPTGDNVYRPLSQAQGITVDILFSNPRVRDRYLRVEFGYPWQSGWRFYPLTSNIPEFDTFNGTRPQLARSWSQRTTTAGQILPDQGVIYFRLVETGLDIPEQSQIAEFHFSHRQPVPPGSPCCQLPTGSSHLVPEVTLR